jgi:hypothetical protein
MSNNLPERKATLFFGELLHAQVRTFNPKSKEAEGAR